MNKFINLHPHEVPSVLSGRQTQFCRVVRPQPYEFEGNYYFSHGKAKGLGLSYAEIACSIGQPGDILVGREAFVSGYPAPGGDVQYCDESGNDLPEHTWYMASPKDEGWISDKGAFISGWTDDDGMFIENIPWKSSTQMPAWASRIHRPIIRVRVMRVQDLTEEDIIKQGWSAKWDIYDAQNRDIFHDQFDSYNALPRPVRKNNQIDHYESYPWEDITETRQYRGKPWKVIGCPWCWIIDVENIQKVT